jgi:hypothetical protein
MKAVVFHHPAKMSVDEAADPKIEKPDDIVLRVTRKPHEQKQQTFEKEKRFFTSSTQAQVPAYRGRA